MKFYKLESLRAERPTGKSKVGDVGIFELSDDDVFAQVEAGNVKILEEYDELPTQSESPIVTHSAGQSESTQDVGRGEPATLHETE